MIISKTFKDGILTVIPDGRLDSATGDEFSEFINENLTAEVNEVVFDFSAVDFISSKGLRILVSTYKNLNGRKMEIVNCNTSVKEVFRISGFLKTFVFISCKMNLLLQISSLKTTLNCYLKLLHSVL